MRFLRNSQDATVWYGGNVTGGRAWKYLEARLRHDASILMEDLGFRA